MIRGRLIVCIASSWDYDPTSKHQIMKVLSRRNDILWINYHGSRRPEMTRSDLRGACATLRRVARGMHRVAPSIVQLTPLVIPGATRPVLRRLHQRMVIAQIRRAIGAVQTGSHKPIQVWSFAPDVPYLVGALDEECFVYYCVDEYTRFEGFNADYIATMENELLERADVVLATSRPLQELKAIKRPDTVLVRHGVDFDHFATAWRSPPPMPTDLAKVPRPIIGFFGLIQHWVDLDLIAAVARMRPLYSFVLIGECKVDASRLRGLDNVLMLGRRAYETLPAYCAAFDAGMMPFALNAMTRHVNPVKMHEYLAAGLPVISTRLPEAEAFGGSVTVVDSAGEFAHACDRAVDAATHSARALISRAVEGHTWESKVEHLSDLIAARVGKLFPAATKDVAEVMPGKRTARELVVSIP